MTSDIRYQELDMTRLRSATASTTLLLAPFCMSHRWFQVLDDLVDCREGHNRDVSRGDPWCLNEFSVPVLIEEREDGEAMNNRRENRSHGVSLQQTVRFFTRERSRSILP